MDKKDNQSETNTLLRGKNILLGVCGGIAAYKIAFLVRLLRKKEANVKVLMTPSAKEFITPITLATLSNNEVYSDFFNKESGFWNSHIDLGLWADMYIIAPATATTLGKLANGIADNLIVTSYLSIKEAQVFLAPSMDLDMFKHPTTQRNLLTLFNDGAIIIDADTGFLASGLEGKGRMAEPEAIVNTLEDYLDKELINNSSNYDSSLTHNRDYLTDISSFSNKRVLITIGSTIENIDAVRYITNASSGQMGVEIATLLSSYGADITCVIGRMDTQHLNRLKSLKSCNIIQINTALDMEKEVLSRLFTTDMFFFTAAVSDYRVDSPSPIKIKKREDTDLILKLVENPDIAKEVGLRKNDHQIAVAFALETNDGIENATKKLYSKNMDFVVLNQIDETNQCFSTETNKVSILNRQGEIREYDLKAKSEVAKDILMYVAENL